VLLVINYCSKVMMLLHPVIMDEKMVEEDIRIKTLDEAGTGHKAPNT
jgi:hypothetical protein